MEVCLYSVLSNFSFLYRLEYIICCDCVFFNSDSHNWLFVGLCLFLEEKTVSSELAPLSFFF